MEKPYICNQTHVNCIDVFLIVVALEVINKYNMKMKFSNVRLLVTDFENKDQLGLEAAWGDEENLIELFAPLAMEQCSEELIEEDKKYQA